MGNKNKILVVEDNKETQLIIKAALRNHYELQIVPSAESALNGPFVHEGLLERMKTLRRLQPFNGEDLRTVCLNGQDETSVHRLSVENDRAGAALAHIAAFLGPRDFKIIA